MVKNISSFGRNGVHDYLLIRASALVLTAYLLFLAYFFIANTVIDYQVWTTFWSSTVTRVFTMLALISTLIHGWIGIWQVLTDYVKNSQARSLLQLIFIIVLLSYLFFGFFILWGV